MSNDTVTRKEMDEAIQANTMDLLKSLGITLTAEMGQTPWLSTSDESESEPLVDLNQMAGLVHDLAHNQEVLMAQGPNPHGLCDAPTCPTCRDQKRVFAQNIADQVEKATMAQAGTEIDKALEHAGVPELRAALMGHLDKYRRDGSPGLDQPEIQYVITA